MSFQITENFTQQFGTNFRILGQQRRSRFEPFVQVEPNIVGTSMSVERIGSTEVLPIESRHSDTKYVDTPHSRRWLDLADFAWADLVDKMDKIKMLADPTTPYLQVGVAAHNRKKDEIILTAATGNARTGTQGLIALPTSQKIAASATGLTLEKLMLAKELLDAAEIDADDITGQGNPTRVMAVTSRQLSNLLNTTQVTSADYNTVQALVRGTVDSFMGFKFIRTERLPKIGNIRYCPAWVEGSVAYGYGQDTMQRIDEMPGKNYSVQVYASGSYGAVRVEDAGVVEIACQE